MRDAHPFATPWERAHARRLGWLALGLVAVGVLWRLTRYLLAFPVWGDEAFLLLNYRTRGFADLFGPIDNCQVAPLLFHAAELAAYKWLGASELAIRLPALLACLGSLALFWRLARLLLPPLAHTLAVGVLAVSIWPATMGSLVKPYTFDLFFSLVLLVPFVTWLRRPESLRPLAALNRLTPQAGFGSFPAGFVGGGIGCAWLLQIARRRDARLWALLAVYGVALGGSFAAHYLFVGLPHMSSPFNGTTTSTGMKTYWRDAFPPASPVAFARWWLLTHTGQMAAYPLGAPSGGSALTVGLGLVGAAWMWKRRQRGLLAVVGFTFALWLLAAALHKYPYGSSCRLSQHVAAMYCLLAGLGAAALLLRLQSQWRATLIVTGLLAAIGLGGAARDVVHPYRDLHALQSREAARELVARVGPEPLFVPYPLGHVDVVPEWYLHRAPRCRLWCSPGDVIEASGEETSLWVLRYGSPWDESAELEGWFSHGGQRWRCVERGCRFQVYSDDREPIRSLQWYHLVREGGRLASGPR
ncbi:MAG: hypothetical protein U0797_19460 [Gemmataceae bacterium]